MSAAAIVPARDEAERIEGTVRALLSIDDVDAVWVVDDGSRDQTGALAMRAGAQVLRSDRNRGKGAAILAGCARAADADPLLLVDGDLGASAAGAGGLLETVVEGRADMAIGAPPAEAPSGFGLVEGLARRGIKALGGVRLHRPLSGQRCLRRAVLDGARLPAGFGFETALTLHALRRGFSVVEVPMLVEHRRTGRDLAGFRHRARQGGAVARALAGRALGFRR